MQLLDLPIETFKLLLQHVAPALGIEGALRLRLVSRTFANEMMEAIFASGVLEETTEDSLASHRGPMGRELRVTRCPDITLRAKYLYSRIQDEHVYPQPEFSETTDFIKHLRLIAREVVTRSGGRFNYETALTALCDIVVQDYNLSYALTDHVMFSGPYGEKYSQDQACLNVACGLGDLDLVSTLLEQEKVKVNPTDPYHFLSFPIRAAVRGGHLDVVENLLQRGSRIEADTGENKEWTIIHDSITSGQLDMLAFVLDKKFEFPVRERHADDRLGSAYEDALITAANQGNDPAFNMLLERGPIKAPFDVRLQQLVLLAACEATSTSIAQFIFDMNPSLDPNYESPALSSSRSQQMPYHLPGNSPLQAAAHWGSMPLIELLLKHGADPNWPYDRWGPPVYRAALQGFDRCKDMLLDAGANAEVLARLEE